MQLFPHFLVNEICRMWWASAERRKVTKNLQDKIRISTIFQLNSDGVSIRRDLSGRLVLWNLLSTIVNLDLDFGEKCIIFVIRKWGTAKIPAVPFVFPHFIVKIRSDFVKISRRLVKKRLRLFWKRSNLFWGMKTARFLWCVLVWILSVAKCRQSDFERRNPACVRIYIIGASCCKGNWRC